MQISCEARVSIVAWKERFTSICGSHKTLNFKFQEISGIALVKLGYSLIQIIGEHSKLTCAKIQIQTAILGSNLPMPMRERTILASRLTLSIEFGESLSMQLKSRLLK
jgi:hypothetical protein